MGMKADRYVTVLVAVCCLVAVGAAAATMDSAVSTSPDQAVNLDYHLLPIGASAVGQLSQKINGYGDGTAAVGAGPDGGNAQRGSNGGDARPSSSDASRSNAANGASDAHRRDYRANPSDRRASALDSQNARRDQSARKDRPSDTGTTLTSRSLLALLLDLLSNAFAVLAVLALAVGVVLAVRRYRGRYRREGGVEDGATPALIGDPSPSNEVSRAWYEMVRRLGLDDRHSLTPTERAAEAAERGADPEAASSLTRLFEDVRYGEAPVTDERRREARRSLDRLRSNPTLGSNSPGASGSHPSRTEDPHPSVRGNGVDRSER